MHARLQTTIASTQAEVDHNQLGKLAVLTAVLIALTLSAERQTPVRAFWMARLLTHSSSQSAEMRTGRVLYQTSIPHCPIVPAFCWRLFIINVYFGTECSFSRTTSFRRCGRFFNLSRPIVLTLIYGLGLPLEILWNSCLTTPALYSYCFTSHCWVRRLI